MATKKKATRKLTPAEYRAQKAATRLRLKATKTLAREARAEKRRVLAEVRSTIKAARRELPKKIAHWREVNRQIMRRAIEGERHAVRAEALAARTGVHGRAKQLATAANEQIDRELKHLVWLGKHRHTPVKSSSRVAAGLRAAELRAEQDEFTRNELPESMWAAWELNKHKIKATPRMTRWEAALEYFHNHPEAVIEANQGALDREIARAIENEEQERAALEPARPRRARQYVSAAARELVPEHYGKKAKPKAKAKAKPKAKAKAKPKAKPNRTAYEAGDSVIRRLKGTAKNPSIGPLTLPERAALEALANFAANIDDLDALATRADFAGLDWAELYPEWREMRRGNRTKKRAARAARTKPATKAARARKLAADVPF